MSINERMFLLMKEKNIKAIDIANKLQVTKSVVSNWKSRGTNPPAEYIELICELLEVSIEYLLTGKEKESLYNLTENEKEMLNNFKILPEREQIKMIGILENKAETYKTQSELSYTSETG